MGGPISPPSPQRSSPPGKAGVLLDNSLGGRAPRFSRDEALRYTVNDMPPSKFTAVPVM
jgi:hypothetical protein